MGKNNEVLLVNLLEEQGIQLGFSEKIVDIIPKDSAYCYTRGKQLNTEIEVIEKNGSLKINCGNKNCSEIECVTESIILDLYEK